MTLAQLLNTKTQIRKSIMVLEMQGAQSLADKLRIDLESIEKQIAQALR